MGLRAFRRKGSAYSGIERKLWGSPEDYTVVILKKHLKRPGGPGPRNRGLDSAFSSAGLGLEF